MGTLRSPRRASLRLRVGVYVLRQPLIGMRSSEALAGNWPALASKRQDGGSHVRPYGRRKQKAQAEAQEADGPP